jgi:cytochrome c oxidase subunit I+III
MSERPTRSMEATTPQAVGMVARARRAQPNGWWGIALLICTEASLLGALIASYFYLRFQNATWPPRGIEVPGPLSPSVLTAVLVLTSIPMAMAARGVKAGALGRIRAAIGFALLVQAAYLAIQLHEYAGELDKHSPGDSAYSSIYYTLLGAHHAHVAVGMLLSLGILIKLRRGLTNYRAVGVRAIALYWHFTNAVAVAVLLTQLSPRL